MSQKRGCYIALEGIDGTGKSTLSARIGEKKPSWFITREPRRLDYNALSSGRESPLVDVLLFAADRVGQMADVSRILSEGTSVLSDRTFYSSMAYQATSLRDMFGSIDAALEWVEQVNKPFLIQPDKVLLLDIPARISLSRLVDRGEKTRFEKEQYLDRVRNTYLILAQRKGFNIVDASRPIEHVLEECLAILESG